MLKLGPYLYVHPDSIDAVSFSNETDIEVWVRGTCFPLASQEAKEDLLRWLREQEEE